MIERHYGHLAKIRFIRFRFSADPILELRNSWIAASCERVDKIVGKLTIHCVPERTDEAARPQI